MNTSEMELAERLRRLERAHKRIKRTAAVAMLLPVLGFTYARAALRNNSGGAAQEPAKVMAHEFDLVDAQGKTRAKMGFDKSGEPSIDLYDAQGKARARVCLGNQLLLDEPLIEFSDAQGRPRTQTFLDSSGAPQLWFSGAGHSEIDMGLNRLGSPRISLLDDVRKFELDLGSMDPSRSAASIVMYNVKESRVIWKAP